MIKKNRGWWGTAFVIVCCLPFIFVGARQLIEAVTMLLDQRAGSDWGEVKSLVFTGIASIAIGSGIIWGILAYKRYVNRKNKLKENYPAQPWMWRKDWASGIIRCSSKAGIWIIGMFAIVWNGFTVPMVFFGWDQIFDPAKKEALIILLFPAAGLFLAFAWLVFFVRYKRFGDSYLQMGSVPGVIGGQLSGVVYISKHLEPDNGFHISLKCIKSVSSGSGDGRTTHDHVMHQDEMTIAKELLASDYTRTALPILFAVPFSKSLATGDHGSDVSVRWTVDVSASVPGLDYKTSFIVPVFVTKESKSGFKLDTAILKGSVVKEDPEEMMRDNRIGHAVSKDRETFTCPMFRNLSMGIGLWIIAGIWFTAVFLMFRAPSEPWPMGIVFALFGLIIWYLALDLFFWKSKVEFLHDGISVKYGIFGLNHCKLSYEAVKRVGMERGMQSGHTLYHNIFLYIEGGEKEKIPIVKRIRNRNLVDVIVDKITQTLADDGQNFRSPLERMQGGQYWVTWKTRLFWWAFVFMLATIFTCQRIRPDQMIQIGKYRAAATQLMMDNPGLKKKPKFEKLAKLRLAGNKAVTNITAISGLMLEDVDVGETGVTDLSPLKGMKLERLSTWATKVSDISVVEGMPLNQLTIGHCPVSDISMLKGMKLRGFSMTRTRVSDISVLKGMPLTDLDLNASRVTDISSLKGAPLKILRMNDIKIDDISVLKGNRRIELLWIANTKVSDLSVVKSMPLKELWIQKTKIRDVSVLADCETLEYILLDPGCKGEEALKRLPNLKRIGYKYGKDTTPAIFFARKKRTAGK